MKPLRTSIIVLVVLTVVTGGLYPLFITGLGAVFFPAQAQGSLISKDGKVVGSRLIGQEFASDTYFHPRPSVVNYDASASGASNWGYTSSDLKKAYDDRLAQWQKENPAAASASVPLDVLFASGSGLDPDISPQAAEDQAPRVAAARHASARDVLDLVRRYEKSPQLGFMGEPRVNVLELNMALDKAFPGRRD